MNKKTIITILLALVAVAGQAQVKSGLDLCLRDEATGENSIHYNLPDKQQRALEHYIGVGSDPTYKIVAPNGNLLPTEAPRPDHLEAIRNMIEKLKNNK